ncbi:MAG: hypothetical protein Q4G11_07230, partial [Gallicola sp.]|nr:hypothetical protein [Gallicola sp.]
PSAKTIYDGVVIAFDIKDHIAGRPDFLGNFPGDTSTYTGMGAPVMSLTDGEPFEFMNDQVIDNLLGLEAGDTYLFRAYVVNDMKMIKPLYEGGPLYEKLSDGEIIDWADAKFEKIKEDIDLLTENLKSFSFISTKDMTKIIRTQDVSKEFYLTKGRWIDHEDHLQENKAGVIHQALAKYQNIDVGDTFTTRFLQSEGIWYLTTDNDREHWQDYQRSKPETFEVVGIFDDHSKDFQSERYVFIPDSTMPPEFGPTLQGLEEYDVAWQFYSFYLNSSKDQIAFVNKYADEIQKAGFRLVFVENNAESFWASVNPVLNSIQSSVILFGLITLLALFLVIYLYLNSYKNSFAIERALGISKITALKHLAMPLLFFIILAIVIGSYYG